MGTPVPLVYNFIFMHVCTVLVLVYNNTKLILVQVKGNEKEKIKEHIFKKPTLVVQKCYPSELIS